MNDKPDLMTLPEVAEYLRVPVNTLRTWRQNGTGPRFVRMGRRLYCRRSEVDAFLRDVEGADVPTDLSAGLAWVRATAQADDEGRRLLAGTSDPTDMLDSVTTLLLTLIADNVGEEGVPEALDQIAHRLH